VNLVFKSVIPLLLLLTILQLPVAAQLCTQGCVTTHGYDNSQDNVNPNESILKASQISTLTASSRADLMGVIYAQPLYLSHVVIGGNTVNALYVATEENYVYAIDEANFTGTPLWIANLNNANQQETAVPDSALPGGCTNIAPEVGITGTPVIDTSVSPPVLYVVSKHINSGGVVTQRLNVLDATTGLPVTTALDIPTVFQTDFSSIKFSAALENQRAALALTYAGGTPQVTVAWGSHCDSGTFVGITATFTLTPGPETTLMPVAAFNDQLGAVQKSDGGIWMSGAGLAVDDLAGQGVPPTGDIFLATGNGDVNYAKGDFGQSVLRLHNSGSASLAVSGFYALNSWKILNNGSGKNCPATGSLALPPSQNGAICAAQDFDLGSGGVILARPTGIALSYNQTPENFVVLAGGKEGVIYVNSPVAMLSNNAADPAIPSTAACSTSGPNSAVQCFSGSYLPANCCGGTRDFGLRGSSAFWAGPDNIHGNILYVTGVQDTSIRGYQMDPAFTTGQFKTTAVGLGDWDLITGEVITYPGASPVVTWNASGGSYQDAILWILDNSKYQRIGINNVQILAAPAALYAYTAEPDGNGKINKTPFFDTKNGPGATKFMVPTVVNGHIYVAGQKKRAYCNAAPCYGAVTMWH